MVSASFPVLPQNPETRRIAEAVNNLLRGKLNATTTVTLTPSAASTTLTDSRIGAASWISLRPLTANAAAALPTTYVSSRDKGVAVITHANNVQADKTFAVLIIG